MEAKSYPYPGTFGYVAHPNVVNSVKRIVQVGGLQKQSVTYIPEGEEVSTVEIEIEEDAGLNSLWQKISQQGYRWPSELSTDEKTFHLSTRTFKMRPFNAIKITDGPSTADEINVNDKLVSHANAHHGDKIAYDIKSSNHSKEAKKSLKNNTGFGISFQRTTRMPDDNKLHQLPPSLGTFDLFNISAYEDRIPKKIRDVGGVFFPMWQREAMWIQFETPVNRGIKNYAVRVFIGKVNAISGLLMDEDPSTKDGLNEQQDYVVVPGQQWLDGICVAPGVVRQFVAMPLGSGYTVEGQKTKEEKHGGLQIEIIPEYQQKLRWWYKHSDPPVNKSNQTGGSCVDLSLGFDENKTPAELGFKAGDVIRSYEPTVYSHEISQVKDLLQDGGDVVWKAKYPPPPKKSHYQPQDCSSSSRTEYSRSMSSQGETFGWDPKKSSSNEPKVSDHSATLGSAPSSEQEKSGFHSLTTSSAFGSSPEPFSFHYSKAPTPHASTSLTVSSKDSGSQIGSWVANEDDLFVSQSKATHVAGISHSDDEMGTQVDWYSDSAPWTAQTKSAQPHPEGSSNYDFFDFQSFDLTAPAAPAAPVHHHPTRLEDEDDGLYKTIKIEGLGEDSSGAEETISWDHDPSIKVSDKKSESKPEPELPKIEDLEIKDLKAMGLAAGGKLIQDVYVDSHPAHIWNHGASHTLNVHIFSPPDFEAITHIVPAPPPPSAEDYAKKGGAFYVVEEKVDDRVEGGDFEGVDSVSKIDKKKLAEAKEDDEFDPKKPVMCKVCEIRLCDCIIRPCGHQFCNQCVRKLAEEEGAEGEVRMRQRNHWRCPTCQGGIKHVAGFSAPMNLPGEEPLRMKVPVHVLGINEVDGRTGFRSRLQMTRI
ncbi:hypothetical protein BU24DRAFT_417132 [Aaosphaeria arxii CBS 175.79]|uniref:RING-type domain-containing protein n=1 Tax=Aaosphaeria arxii CBS 175.79 TaxID=1450172 RepID=A0A6A5Y8C7_9PLEO|nr:uncharacterized protein BU24DRAFT_417132 [Aaosphaeria arxii CBS 175.79]KAF2021493.1 hypothetical protein BU24DRAFT_417132 [Aaosphaeria arxii CBS 175.79]